MYDLAAAVLPLIAVLVLIVLVARWRGLGTSSQRALRRTMDADPWVSAARFAGFALTDAINASGDVEGAARQAARTAIAAYREPIREPPTGVEAVRARLAAAAAAAESAAESAATLARTIRLRQSEIMHAAESSPLKREVLSRAGSEALEYLSYAEETASSLDEAAEQARRAAAEARNRVP